MGVSWSFRSIWSVSCCSTSCAVAPGSRATFPFPDEQHVLEVVRRYWGFDGLRPLQGEAIATGTMLPLTAIYQKDGAPAVWIYDPASKQVNLRTVQLGPFREDGVLVNAGLKGGEWVVTAGVHKLVPGQTVRPLDNVAKS